MKPSHIAAIINGDVVVENKDVSSDTSVQKILVIPGKVVCKHCGKEIVKAKLVGLSLICPHCKKPQNGIHHLKL